MYGTTGVEHSNEIFAYGNCRENYRGVADADKPSPTCSSPPSPLPSPSPLLDMATRKAPQPRAKPSWTIVTEFVPDPEPIDVSKPRQTRSALKPTLPDSEVPPTPRSSVKRPSQTTKEKQLAKRQKAERADRDEEDRMQQDISTIAAIEDEVKRKHQLEQRKAERPDIASYRSYEPPSPVALPSSDADMGFSSSGGFEFIGPDTSDSDGLGLGDQDLNPESDSDGDTYKPKKQSGEGSAGDDSEDDSAAYLSDADFRTQFNEMKKVAAAKKKEKKAKGALRSAVNEKRRIKPTTHSSVKVTMEDESKSDSESDDGRSRKKASAPLEGFKKGYKKLKDAKQVQLAAVAQNVKSEPVLQNASAEKPKPPAPVLRQSKAVALSQKEGTKKYEPDNAMRDVEMGVTLNRVTIPDQVKASAIPAAVPKKANYSTKDLPLSGSELRVWKAKVLPEIYSWAGTLPDAFSINSDEDFDGVIHQALERALPDIEFSKLFSQVTAAAIRTWRSEIGKEALEVVNAHFNSESGFARQDARAKFVTEQLSEIRYVYEDPVTKKGAYRAPLLLRIHAYHQSSIAGCELFFNHPVGALAFAATALERALSFWKGGMELGTKSKLEVKPWGARVNFHASQIARLGDQHWQKIEVATKAYIPDLPTIEVPDADDDETTEREAGTGGGDVVVISDSDDE
ncbi:hypothetical protein DFP72DRAFT_1138359 [Ephemerocybe angulata]|uniref:DUF6532 domain-containing protein n=1 Tax=Ephemerocybe angulata TaxID=980116 RepID=A0A8H6HRC1_9AGAR|nr:hypothetical protein DFP72DRAFT_1138359 [Tulosesus angulatus]